MMKFSRALLAGLLLAAFSLTSYAVTFTPAQITTIKAAIAADPVLAGAAANSDGSAAIAAAFDVVDQTFFVWQSATPTANILDAITLANLTPADTPDATVTYTNRSLICQIKQMNLQLLLQGRDSVSSGKANVRAALQDALINIPSGTAGALVGAGWTGVKTAMERNATRLEKLLATGTGTAAAPAALGFEGIVLWPDIDAVRNAP